MTDDDDGSAIKVVKSGAAQATPDPLGVGNPFGAPSGNPFASSPASHPVGKEGSSNPFKQEALSNPFNQEASSNPFNQEASPKPPASNPFAKPQASNPFLNAVSDEGSPQPGGTGAGSSNPFLNAATSPPSGSGLDLANSSSPGGLEVETLDRPTTAPRPEVDDWNQGLSTGEYKIQTGEAQSGEAQSGEAAVYGGAPDVITQSLSTPVASRAPRAGSGQPRAVPVAENDDGGKTLKIVFAVVMGLAILGVGGKVVYGKMTRKTTVVSAPSDVETDAFVRRMQADAQNAPDCWASDDGYSFVYRGKAGASVKVDAISDVPVLYRKSAVCVPD